MRFKDFLNESKTVNDTLKIFSNVFGENMKLYKETSTMKQYRCESLSRESDFAKLKEQLQKNEIGFKQPPSSIKFGFDININDVTYRFFLKPPHGKKEMKLSAEDFEIVACTVNNMRFSKTIDDAYEMSNAVSSNKDLIIDVAQAYLNTLGKSFEKMNFNEPLLVTTRSGDKPTQKWHNYFNEGGGKGSPNNTPKTDIFSKSSKYKISVKKGAAQLLSSGSGETYATFKVASENTDYILDKIKQNMMKYVDDLNVTEIKKLKEDEMTAVQKMIYETITNNKSFKKEIQGYLSSNPEIRTKIAYEAMTGNEKFGKDSLSSANYMLKLSDAGDEIMDFLPIDMTLANKYGNKAKIDIAFKSSGKTKWSSFRMITESAIDEVQKEALNEGIIDWTKEQFTRVKKYFKRVVEKIIDKLILFKEKIFEMLGLTIKIDLKV